MLNNAMNQSSCRIRNHYTLIVTVITMITDLSSAGNNLQEALKTAFSNFIQEGTTGNTSSQNKDRDRGTCTYMYVCTHVKELTHVHVHNNIMHILYHHVKCLFFMYIQCRCTCKISIVIVIIIINITVIVIIICIVIIIIQVVELFCPIRLHKSSCFICTSC